MVTNRTNYFRKNVNYRKEETRRGETIHVGVQQHHLLVERELQLKRHKKSGRRAEVKQQI